MHAYLRFILLKQKPNFRFQVVLTHVNHWFYLKVQVQQLQTRCSKAKSANTTTPLTRPLECDPVGGQVSGVALHYVLLR